MIRVLCTGADGFIGRNLIRILDDIAMIDLVCVDKHPQSKRTIKLDVADPDFIKYFTHREEPFDYVFHLGSPCSVIQFNQNPTYCVGNTLTGFRNTLRLAERWEAKLIYPSSGNIYGVHNTSSSEQHTPDPTNLYGVCKLQCEVMAHDADTETIGLRIFAGYGPGEERKDDIASVVYIFLRNMINGESPVIWGDGSQIRDFIHIDDITHGLIKAMGLQGSHIIKYQIINLGTGRSYAFNDVIDIINEVRGSDIQPVYIDKPNNYVETAQADVTLMKQTLGINPRSLKEGITQFSDYLEG